MLGKKSSIIELNDLVYKERHDVKKQAQMTDDWMTNVFVLTLIHPGTSTGSVLDRTMVGKPAKLPHPKLRQPTYAQTFQCAKLPQPKLRQSTDVQRSQRTLRATQVRCALVRAYAKLLQNRTLWPLL
jgi:hypothetical protein